MLRLVAVVLPLALDTFAVSAALGMIGLPTRRRVQLSLLFAAFEGGMPMAGLAVGAALGTVLGSVADFVAIAALAGLGAYLLLGDEEREEARIARFASAGGGALIAVGISVSLDELAIGFALGLTGVPIVPALILIALQAFAASQLGFALGRRVGESVREGAERLAGVALLLLAAVLLLSRFVALPVGL
ncbi:MAG TPA: manganese efflux pump [Candidatus Dormibacteraeota bacterium]|nr:manganese efflux pump [Candidatus Dormibacteraeota bacterium]